MNFTKEFKALFEELNLSISQIPEKYLILGLKKPLEPLVFKSPDSFFSYIEVELAFWQENFSNLERNLPFSGFIHNMRSAKDNFEIAHSAVDNLNNKNEFGQQQAVELCKLHLNKMKNCLVNVNDAKNIYSETVLAKKFLENKDETHEFFSGFCFGIEHVNSNRIPNVTTRGFMFGLFAAYEYIQAIQGINRKLPDVFSDIEDMKTNYQNRSNESLDEYDKLLEAKKHDFHQIELTIEEKNTERSDTFDIFIRDSKYNMKNIETTYEEKLKLEKPAEYWKKMSENYNKDGKIWLGITSISALIGVVILMHIMISTYAFTGDDVVLAIRNMAILSVIVAAIMYVLGMMVKVSMSSFHLARDAKEREQLSYFYLALSKNGLVDEKERELVLSALFSRFDTGMLKGDSSPEIPQINKLAEIINKR